MLNFYDFEVFAHDWLVVVINPIEKTKTVLVNDRDGLSRLYDERKDQIFVGYNNCHYDQYIFKGLLLGLDAKWINDQIIVKDRSGWAISREFSKIPMINYDVMLRNDLGLKTLEAYMGNDIRETTVPFDIDRKLTKAELDDVIFYCTHDVEQTIEVFARRKSEFTAKLDLIKMFDLPMSYLSKTGAQLTAIILEAKRPREPRDDEFDLEILPCVQLGPYDWVRQWYLKPENQDYDATLKFDIAGCPHVCKWGGIHGALEQYSADGYLINVDVESYYPSEMIVHGFLSRNVSNPSKFAWIKSHRLELKHAGDKRQKSLKVVINGTYGASKDPTNALYDPKQANQVCINGQLMLIDLMWHLTSGCGAEIIQSNTDGVLVKMPDGFAGGPDAFYSSVDDIAAEWESRTGMQLEFDEYAKVYQKDVNNYILVAEDGHTKGKGAYVKELSELDADMPVVNRALIAYMVDGVPPEVTINSATDLIDFQRVVKLSGKYLYCMHGSERLQDKCFRVFASKRLHDGGIFKVKRIGKKPEKFACTSDHVFIDNGDIHGKPSPDYLDRRWYIDLAYKRLEQFGVA